MNVVRSIAGKLTYQSTGILPRLIYFDAIWDLLGDGGRWSQPTGDFRPCRQHATKFKVMSATDL